jgi:hypothetical protein
MPTIKTQATEMKHASVQRISLVSKAASRIPFRVIKEDRSMQNPLKTLDLAQVFKGKKPDAVPTVVGIVTLKGDHFEIIKKAVADAGLKVDAVIENADGSVIFKQGDIAEGEPTVIVKMSDEVAVALKGFSPYCMDMSYPSDAGDNASFSDMCKAQGFFPGVSTMMDVLASSVREATYKSDSPDAAAESISKMFDEAKSYALSMVKSLPVAAFKAEMNANGSMATANKLPSGADGVTVTSNLGGATVKEPLAGELPGSASAATGVGDGSQVAKSAEEIAAAAEAAKKGEGAAGAAAPAAGAEGVAKAAEDPATVFGKMLQDGLNALGATFGKQITESVGQVQKSVDGLNKAVGDLGTKVSEVEGVAKAAQQAVKGTVLGSDEGADAHQTTQKSEQGGRGREIDTAFMPRRRAAR